MKGHFMRALLVFAACLLIWMEPAGAASGPELPETGSIQETTSSDAHVIHIAHRNAQPRRRNYRTRQDVALGRVFDPLTRTWVDPVTTRDRRDIARYRRALVPLVTEVPAGTIIIDPDSHYLYLTLPNDEAIRYGVGLGREGFGWSGTVEIGRKAEWPVWTPPADMVKREPWLAEYANGMPGGEDNPLGARALYLYENCLLYTSDAADE